MRLKVTGAVTALLLASMASAGAQAPPPPPPVMMQGMSWTGFYAGASFGGDWTEFDKGSVTVGPGAATTGAGGTAPATAAGTVLLDNHASSSIAGGGQIGYNWQGPKNWVLGGELNFNGTGTSRATVLGAQQIPSLLPFPFVPGDKFRASSSWNGSARLRLGYAWGPVLPYITGGVAFADSQITSNFIPIGIFPASAASASSVLVGWTVGGGIEYALSPSWSLGAEYRFSDYGSNTYSLGRLSTSASTTAGTTTFTTAPVRATFGENTQTVLVTLNYHFGAQPAPAPPMPPPPPPPVAAKVFIVFFDWDKDTITPEGQAIIQQAADAYKAGASVQMQIQVTGYTDRSGSAGYNQRLSERRANNVAKAMLARGVPPASMVVAGHGENDNRVPTADGVREPQNRRVEIVEP